MALIAAVERFPYMFNLYEVPSLQEFSCAFEHLSMGKATRMEVITQELIKVTKNTPPDDLHEFLSDSGEDGKIPQEMRD